MKSRCNLPIPTPSTNFSARADELMYEEKKGKPTSRRPA